MPLPYFFSQNINESNPDLDEETSRHIIQVLRMQQGEHLMLTDGNGNTAEAEITAAHKKHCGLHITKRNFTEQRTPRLTIAISLIKNASRFEWFVEKATELGTAEIIPLLCERTERQKFRHDRFLGICKSAMLQSMQCWLPNLHEPQHFKTVIASAIHAQKFIAHCAPEEKKELKEEIDSTAISRIILIGPEGDFTSTEISFATQNGFVPVALGPTRLRTETAGVYAATVLQSK
jgi:16S rRNA (uracil1498-N3)-methyltransferase